VGRGVGGVLPDEEKNRGRTWIMKQNCESGDQEKRLVRRQGGSENSTLRRFGSQPCEVWVSSPEVGGKSQRRKKANRKTRKGSRRGSATVTRDERPHGDTKGACCSWERMEGGDRG